MPPPKVNDYPSLTFGIGAPRSIDPEGVGAKSTAHIYWCLMIW
jgi:hypothetical protein